jgi:hypothetical protein
VLQIVQSDREPIVLRLLGSAQRGAVGEFGCACRDDVAYESHAVNTVDAAYEGAASVRVIEHVNAWTMMA